MHVVVTDHAIEKHHLIEDVVPVDIAAEDVVVAAEDAVIIDLHHDMVTLVLTAMTMTIIAEDDDPLITVIHVIITIVAVLEM